MGINPRFWSEKSMKKSMLNKTVKNTKYVLGILLCIGVICLSSCKVKKHLVAVKKMNDSLIKPTDTRDLIFSGIRSAQVNFNTFSAKARTKLDINGNSNDVTLNIRIKKDQKIWVSITAIAGIEVARAMITPDSIMVINRLQGLFIKKPFSYVWTFAGSHVNYKTIESLLLGNVIPELINDNGSFENVANQRILSGQLDEILYKVVFGGDLKVLQLNLSNQHAGQSLQVNNNGFNLVDNREIPTLIDIQSIVKDKKFQVNLHYIKIDFDQSMDFPFTIPSRYQAAN